MGSWHGDPIGTVAINRPPTVLFNDAQVESEGQHASPGKQWQLLANAVEAGTAIAEATATVIETFMATVRSE